MNKIELQELIEEGATQREMAAILKCGQSTIRYWLKKHKLATRNGPRPRHTVKRCKCGETELAKFYGTKSSICKKCHNAYTMEKGKENRDYIIKFLGGKCARCQYDEFKPALTVHHLDPNSKDPRFSSIRSWSKKRIDDEMKQCVLLCACCHNALHTKEWNISEIGLGEGRTFDPCHPDL